MAKNLNFPAYSYVNLCLVVLCTVLCRLSCSPDEDSRSYNTFTVSSLNYPQTELQPYAWRYIRVDLPAWFSSLSVALETNVKMDAKSLGRLPRSSLPIICLRDGSPPLPDTTDTSSKSIVLSPLTNRSFEEIQGHQNLEQCYPMQKNINVKLTNAQISPGVWYFGLFNGIGPKRTQSRMITRGLAYSFSGSINVEGCTIPTMWGQYCNQTVEPLSCSPYNNSFTKSLLGAQSDNQSMDYVVYCDNSSVNSCHEIVEPKIFSFEVVGVVQQLTIMGTGMKLNDTSNDRNISEIKLTCFARHGSIPLTTSHDYMDYIDKSPLVISRPKIGRWYIMILPVNMSKENGKTLDASTKVCYIMKWEVIDCPEGVAGPNCLWKTYVLQRFLKNDPTAPFESYYFPVSRKVSPNTADFLLEPLLSNTSSLREQDGAWTYFLLDVPHGAAGGNLHIRLTSNTIMNYKIYARFGGLPSVDSWDYFYTNESSSSNGSTFFKLYDSSEETIDFYIFYVREGTWSFGLRHSNFTHNASNDQTFMSIFLERCPKRCSSHGECRSVVDTSGLTIYSYCVCDRDHGGFDCSVEIISPRGHTWRSIFLIASNAAAVLPAFWALREKAFAEWVIFTSSGISSGLYHACDVGTWCALNFRALQFMDFWLSFIAVISTFVYLAYIDEASKRTIHTVVSISTAILAVTGATRSANIIIVIAIGSLGLLIGWMIEFSTQFGSTAFSVDFCMNFHDRWQGIRGWFHDLVKTLVRRFHWGYVLAGFITIVIAGTCWALEASETYWIWHSAWHLTIYTSSFLFLRSKVNLIDNDSERPAAYELTRQDSFGRVG